MSDDYQELLAGLLAHYGDWFRGPDASPPARMTQILHPYTALFAPIQVNSLTLKNRIVMGPMGNINMADETGRPGPKMLAYFAERARGGAGLLTSGLVPVSQGIDPTVTEPGDRSLFPRIDRARTTWTGWRDLAETVHAHGAHFFIQLTTGLGRVGSPECLLKQHRLPISASWNPSFYAPQVPCRPLTDGECRRIINAAGQAAADAKALLIDGVYLHGHEGYLLGQMTDPAFNRRKWGRYANHQAFGCELIAEIRRRTGAHYPIMYRIDLSLALAATYGERMRTVPSLRKFVGERTVAMTLDYMAALVLAGVDLFDVDLGCYDNWWLPHPPGPMPPGAYLALARLVRQYLAGHDIRSNAGLPVPVVAVGKLGYPDVAEKALREGACDLVMLARPLLADPAWPNKAFAGRVAEIIPCIGDQEGCLNEFLAGGHPQCAVNPRTGFEDTLAGEPPPTTRPRRVAVVGAGPAGILCACTASARGHDVTLFERRAVAGGMLVPGSRPAIKFDVANYLTYLQGLLARHQRDHGLQMRWETDVTAVTLREGGYDAAVICTGGRQVTPRVPGIGLSHVMQAVDLLMAPEQAAAARKIVVIGGGAVGCEIASFLAGEMNKQVTVIEMQPAFMPGVCTANRGYLIHYLERTGVCLLNCTRLAGVEPGSVTVLRNVSPTVPDPYVTWAPLLPDNVKNPLTRPLSIAEEEQHLPADLVVLAVGLVPDDNLYHACIEGQAAPEIRMAGDAFAPARVLEAVKAGYAVGCAV